MPAETRKPKWEADAEERIAAGLRRLLRPIKELVGRDANEGDTRLLVTDLLCDVLGYDKYSELSTEYRVRGDFADYAIRVEGETLAMVEVKRATTKLTVKHLRQVEMYGVNEGVEWLILTNGAQWQVYRLIPGMPVSVDLVIEIDLLDDSATVAKKAAAIGLIAKEFLKRGHLEELWKVNAATSPEKLVEVVLSEAVVAEARRELKRQTGHRIDDADLARLIRDTVVRADLAS
ncbi:MAG: type I restriction enzyme HsdR N-terminal domain-containing protein [Bifidobacteriaceae bacterium]|nr:type I restriction enzyme HsdR N-terminal domain-containing protein [Bifidobacteriaceae bacterium]